uniref:Uncharacterized protein n=1 Tax=Rhizophora mucronata TaxID=61149 RepID=A0A2P2KF29_RHIMU
MTGHWYVIIGLNLTNVCCNLSNDNTLQTTFAFGDFCALPCFQKKHTIYSDNSHVQNKSCLFLGNWWSSYGHTFN